MSLARISTAVALGIAALARGCAPAPTSTTPSFSVSVNCGDPSNAFDAIGVGRNLPANARIIFSMGGAPPTGAWTDSTGSVNAVWERSGQHNNMNGWGINVKSADDQVMLASFVGQAPCP